MEGKVESDLVGVPFIVALGIGSTNLPVWHGSVVVYGIKGSGVLGTADGHAYILVFE